MLKNKTVSTYIIFFVLSLILFFVLSHGAAIMNADDLWNYNFVQNVASGKIPYLETNIMVPPLYHFTAALFLTIFGKKYFSLMLYQVLVEAIFYTIFYMFIDKHLKTRISKIIAILLGFWIFSSIVPIQYNGLFVLFAFSALCLADAKFKKHSTKDILTGILLGLALLCKQTYGGVFIFFYFVFLLISKSFKERFGTTVLGLLIPNSIFLAYLLITKSFFAFCDQCIYSLFEFANKNLVFAALNIVPAIALGALSAILNYRTYKNTKESHYLLYAIFCVASLFLVYPIFNIHHLYLSFFIILPTLVLQFERIFLDIKTEKVQKATKKLIVFITIFIAIATVGNAFMRYEETKYFENMYGLTKFYSYSAIVEDSLVSVKNVVDFIEEKKSQGYTPVVLSSDGPIYYIFTGCPIKYDLVLSGNMGYDGVKNVITEVEKIHNPLILKRELQDYCYQEPEALEDYVLENYEQAGEIEELRIFEKKK